MFESPFFNQFEWHHASTGSKTKGIFRAQELNELKKVVKRQKSQKPASVEAVSSDSSQDESMDQIDDDGDEADFDSSDEEVAEDNAMSSGDELQYTEKRVRGNVTAKNDNERVEYIGLLSQGVFNESGELTSDVFNQTLAEKGLERAKRQRQSEATDVPSDKKVRRVGFNAERNYDIYNAGLEILPRNSCRPRVIRDSDRLTAIYSSPEKMSKLSPKVQKILKRTNYKLPCSLEYCRYDDDWIVKGLRPRSAQVMANLLYISMSRGDDEQAWRILTCLIREPNIKVRSVWLIALELLHWKESLNPSDQEPLDERFLDWLIINYPSKHYRPTRWRSQPRSGDAIPFLTLTKLARGAVGEAFEQIEDAITHAPYSSDPVCWALCGVASLRAQGRDPKRFKKTQRYFARCKELGGVIPEFLERLAHTSEEDSSESANDSEESESNIEPESKSPVGESKSPPEMTSDGQVGLADSVASPQASSASDVNVSDIDTMRRDSDSDTDA